MNAVRSKAADGDSARWSTTVGDVCDQFGGGVQTGPFGSQLHAFDYADDGTPVVMPQDLSDGKIVTDRIARVASRHVLRLKQHQLEAGDIVYSRRGDVARFAVVSDAERGWLCGTGCIRIRLNCPDLDIRYARRYLQQPSIGKWLLHNAKGVTMPNLNTAIVRALPFMYPPLPEQWRIAAILDAADALRAKRRAAIAKLDELTQSIFLDMFGDPATNPRGWKVAPLESMCLIAGEYGAGVASKPFDRDLPRYVRITDITDGGSLTDQPVSPAGSPDKWRQYELAPGDVLFARSGATVGKTYLHRPGHGSCVFAGYLIRFRPDRQKLLPEYLFQFTKSVSYRSWVAARQRVVAQPNINAKQYGSDLHLPLPPIDRQQAFVSRVHAVETVKAAAYASRDHLNDLFASLQHRAFRGEL